MRRATVIVMAMMMSMGKIIDEIGGDTDVLENTDQEVTAVNLSIKSAKVVLLPYSGKKELDKISLDYLILVF